MINEPWLIARFILTVEMLSLIAFPISFPIFRNLKDRGYLVSKIVAPFMLGYIFFALRAVGWEETGIAFQSVAVIILLSASLLFLIKQRREISDFLKSDSRVLILSELLFWGCFAAAIVIKAGSCDIQGSEKMPDYSIYAALLQDGSFPAGDPWLSGNGINYYFMGHFAYAAVTKIAAIPPQYGFNLGTVLSFSLIFAGALGFAYNITGKITRAAICAVSCSFLGNLDAFFSIFSKRGFDWWHSAHGVIPGGINEFPFFSFLLGDLHAHFISAPLFFVLLSLSLNITLPHRKEKEGHDGRFEILLRFILPFAATGGFILTANAWGYPGAVLILVLSLLAYYKNSNGMNLSGLFKTLFYGIACVSISFLCFLPFFLIFRTPTTGLSIVPISLTTRMTPFIILFGFPFLFAALYIIKSLSNLWRLHRHRLLIYAVCAIPALIAASLVRTAPVGILLLSCLLSVIAVTIAKPRITATDIALLTSVTLILFCEHFAVSDLYPPEFVRMNTVFKFHYIAHILLFTLAPLFFFEIYDGIGRPLHARITALSFAAIFIASSFYPFLAVKKLNLDIARDAFHRPATLDGFWFLSKYHRNELDAIEWIKANTSLKETILEATGDPYGYYARFSTFTGRPTVLGWSDHELVWRGPAANEDLSARRRSIREIYTRRDKKKIMDLLRSYKIKLIVVGSLERNDYPKESLQGFGKTFRKIYENPQVDIYSTDYTISSP